VFLQHFIAITMATYFFDVATHFFPWAHHSRKTGADNRKWAAFFNQPQIK